MKYVAIDLVHSNNNMLGNVMTAEAFTQLLEEMRRWEDYSFFLLTSKQNHAFYATYDSENMRSVCIANAAPLSLDEAVPYDCFDEALVPSKISLYMRAAIQKAKHTISKGRILAIRKLHIHPKAHRKLYRILGIPVGLTFCPSGVPEYYDRTLSQLVIPMNLVCLEFPYIPTPLALRQARQIFRNIVDNHMYCLMFSEYSRFIFSKSYQYGGDMLPCIPGFVPSDPRKPINNAEILCLLSREKKLVYCPSPARPELEHNALLTAFSMYMNSEQHSNAHLVLSELTQKQRRKLIKVAEMMEISESVSFFETLSISERGAILEKSRMVVFTGSFEEANPFLFEAIDKSVRVFCANNQYYSSLPEEVVEYFDYRDPKIICDTIHHSLSSEDSGCQQQGIGQYLSHCSLRNYSTQLRQLFDYLYNTDHNQ